MRVASHRNAGGDTNVRGSSKKGQPEPPARYGGYFAGFTTSNNTRPNRKRNDDDDIESRGIVPLTSLDDDDSDVLSPEDRYSIEGPRDPAPMKSNRKNKGLRRLTARQQKVRFQRTQMEPEAFDGDMSFQSADMTASSAETEPGGCVKLFDTIFLCVDKEEGIQKAPSRESESSGSTPDLLRVRI